MKFGTLLELNSNIEWWNHYVDYDALKKLFPSIPLDPDYLSTQQHRESTSLLPTHRPGSDKWATPEEFREALDRERQKVEDFYKSKYGDVVNDFKGLQEEIASIEDRELSQDTIKEENEEDQDQDQDQDGLGQIGEGNDEDGEGEMRQETDGLLSPSLPVTKSTRPTAKSRTSFINRLAPNLGRRRRSIIPTGAAASHEAEIFEATLAPGLKPTRSNSQTRTRERSNSGDPESSPRFGAGAGAGAGAGGNKGRRSSEIASSEEGLGSSGVRDRRMSMSSASSHDGAGEPDFGSSRSRVQTLGLVPLSPAEIPEFASNGAQAELEHGPVHDDPVYVWMSKTRYGIGSRLEQKKKISRVWLEAYALKEYVDLNMKAFEKILKKYDKNTNNKLKKAYIEGVVSQTDPWLPSTREELDTLLAQVLFLYRRVVTGGDEDQAKKDLASQLREKVVVDRETVWSQMVSGHRSQGIFRSVEQEGHGVFEPSGQGTVKTPLGRLRIPTWWSIKGVIFLAALAVLVTITQLPLLDRQEETNCLGMLVFCTILWATEAIPLFVTSLSVPFLVVILRCLRSSDGKDTRLSASDATKFIFSQMFNPTIMLLIGGFTIAAVLSKTRLDVMTASRILNAAGSKPAVVLLVLMSVATFASMWISNVAAPTLCYALVKPILDELHPKSQFSKCLIIAIALASNIGGQASPISSPQNLIALGAMDPPLSWLQWFAISLPVSSTSIIAIWALLQVNYRWEADLMIPRMRKNTDSLTETHYFVLGVSGLTIVLWCAEKSIEGYVGDMGIIALIPLLAFFGTGILSKEDFHSFHWSIVFLAMGGIALGKATLSSGLLDYLDQVLEKLVEEMGLYSILIIFSMIALVIATFISHTIAAVLLVPIAERIGDSLGEPHPRLLIMATGLICSAGMGLPVSGFPNMTAITQENKLGQRFIGASDFLKNGIPASLLATLVIVTLGYAIMRALDL